MNPVMSADNREVVAEFHRLLADTCADQHLVADQGDHEFDAAFGSLRDAISRGGWDDVAATGTGDGEDVSLLAALIEAAGTVTPTPAYPLLETWSAQRVLHQVAAAAAAGDGGLVVADLSGPLTGDQQRQIPFGRSVEALLHLVPATTPGEWQLRLLKPDSTDLELVRQPDTTRPVYRLGGDPTSGDVVAEVSEAQARQWAAEAVLLEAAEMLGAASALLAMTISHTSQRQQFGRPLTGFQAVSHRIVDGFVHLETLRSLVGYAAWVADTRPEDLLEYALMAKGYAGEHAWEMANTAVQLHGGMGFTWEMGLHFSANRIIVRALAAPSAEACAAMVGSKVLGRRELLPLIE